MRQWKRANVKSSKGWKYEPARHGLAAKGIKTGSHRSTFFLKPEVQKKAEEYFLTGKEDDKNFLFNPQEIQKVDAIKQETSKPRRALLQLAKDENVYELFAVRLDTANNFSMHQERRITDDTWRKEQIRNYRIEKDLLRKNYIIRKRLGEI